MKPVDVVSSVAEETPPTIPVPEVFTDNVSVDDTDIDDSPELVLGDEYDYIEDSPSKGIDVVTSEIYAKFVGVPDAKPENFVFKAKEYEARLDELEAFVIHRIIASQKELDRASLIKVAAWTIVQLAAKRDKTGKVTEWTVSEETATKLAAGHCMNRAMELYEYQEVTGTVTRLNASMGFKEKGMPCGDGKKSFNRELFNAIATKSPTFIYPKPRAKNGETPVLSQEEKKRLTRSVAKSINFTAANGIAKEIHDLKKRLDGKEWTADDHAEMDLLKEKQVEIWSQFYTETNAAFTNADKFFGKGGAISKKRETLRTAFRNAVTNDSISFGIHADA